MTANVNFYCETGVPIWTLRPGTHFRALLKHKDAFENDLYPHTLVAIGEVRAEFATRSTIRAITLCTRVVPQPTYDRCSRK